MKIGFFSDRYLPQTDGVAYSIESFRKELERLGHEVYIIAPAAGLRVKETNNHVIRFRAVKGLLGEYDYMASLFFPPTIVRKLDKIGLDIIHFHTPGQVGLLGAYYALHHNIPLVTTYHTDLYEYVRHYPGVLPGIIALSMMTPIITGGGMDDYRVGFSSIKPERSIDRWNQKIVQRSVTLVHNYCDLVIAPSEKMAIQLKDWKTESPMTILPTGIDEITTTKSEIEQLRHLLDLTTATEVILSVGRIGTEKNLMLLLKSFALIASTRPQTMLVIVGDGPARPDLMSTAAELGLSERVIFPGMVAREKLGAYYGVATVFCFPSLADTQGLVVNEAALSSVPLVVIDPHVSDVMRDHQTGLYAKPTAKDLAAKLTVLLNDRAMRKTYGGAAKLVAQEYSATAQAQKLLRLYQEASNHHRDKISR
jgi:1,2-diacylglycerol 3-alpha-glucosyltransferase